MQPPFNDLTNVTKLIKLYKEGVSLLELSYFFECSHNVIKNTLLYHRVPLRKRVGNQRIIVETEPVDKYDYLINEPRCQGKNYFDLLKEKGIKIQKSHWGKL